VNRPGIDGGLGWLKGCVHAQDIAVPAEFRERAVRMVRESGDRGAVKKVAAQLGVHTETVRKWLRQSQMDVGERPGLTSDEREELRRLRKENRELRQANEILKDASAFFARELDSRRSR
jgi:transposase